MRTDFELIGTPLECGPDVDAGLLRVTQESPANVAKHADAARAKVTLTFEGDGVRLDVSDDGSGFDPERASSSASGTGLGLVGIRERIASLGGAQTIESSPGAGSTVAVWVPLRTDSGALKASTS